MESYVKYISLRVWDIITPVRREMLPLDKTDKYSKI